MGPTHMPSKNWDDVYDSYKTLSRRLMKKGKPVIVDGVVQYDKVMLQEAMISDTAEKARRLLKYYVNIINANKNIDTISKLAIELYNSEFLERILPRILDVCNGKKPQFGKMKCETC